MQLGSSSTLLSCWDLNLAFHPKHNFTPDRLHHQYRYKYPYQYQYQYQYKYRYQYQYQSLPRSKIVIPNSGIPNASLSKPKFKTRCVLVAASSGQVLQDAGAAALVTAGAYYLVLLFDNLTQRQLIKQNLSRKVVHILSGLLFMLSWPIFSISAGARYFAAFVPFLNGIRLVIYGLSLASDEGLIKSVTREGNPKELLRGPLYYVIVLISCAVLFWRDSPVGVIALAMMCGGDGFADMMGRRFGSVKIPYNQHKSLIGSISMFLSGFSISIAMLYYFSALGFFQLEWSYTEERVALVALVATVVESLPTTEVLDDNISVPLSAMLMAILLFPLSG